MATMPMLNKTNKPPKMYTTKKITEATISMIFTSQLHHVIMGNITKSGEFARGGSEKFYMAGFF